MWTVLWKQRKCQKNYWELPKKAFKGYIYLKKNYIDTSVLPKTHFLSNRPTFWNTCRKKYDIASKSDH